MFVNTMARKQLPNMYTASYFGKEEEKMMQDFHLQRDDAYNYFINIIKPRLDRAYKLYIAYTGDRQREIKSWQANIFVPYVQAVVETLMPRILDARPDFSVIGRTEEDQVKSEKQQQLGDYFWELAEMDKTAEDFTRASLIYGTGYLQVWWKKDVRKLKFLKTKDVNKKKPEWKEEERTFYDGPTAEWVDNYALWYDWHNTSRKSKQYWFKRLVLSEEEIVRRYPSADPVRLKMALDSGPGDTTDYASVRQTVRSAHEKIVKGAANAFWSGATTNAQSDKYGDNGVIKMYEVYEWTRPFSDKYSVHVGAGYVPILNGGCIPLPFDFKEAPFIEAAYLKVPGEFEGYGLPLILENPQIMLNLIKNQRLDAATLNIHKMWIVNPLANINRNELVTRPFGIIYSIDPNGVKEVQFSDLKASAYKEEEMLKGDMRYSSGVDDFSMGVGGDLQGGGATAVRHLRESTLERVRLFVNHLGDAYSDVLRYWMDMARQLMTEKMTIRIIGENGQELYPIIERDDLMGRYDYKATVLPSIAGQQDVNKKQAMDLFQLLSQMDPATTGVDMRKLVTKLISNWGWSLDSISSPDQGQMGQPGMDPSQMEGMEGMEGMDPAMMEAMMQGGMAPDPAMMGGGGMPGLPEAAPGAPSMPFKGRFMSPDAMQGALSMLRSPGEMGVPEQPSPFNQLSSPVNLLNTQGPPPTPRGAGGPGPARNKGTSNPRGLNRSGKVNTNIATSGRDRNSSSESQLLNRAFNIQR